MAAWWVGEEGAEGLIQCLRIDAAEGADALIPSMDRCPYGRPLLRDVRPHTLLPAPVAARGFDRLFTAPTEGHCAILE